MIDLTKTQIIEPAIEAWFRDTESSEWTKRTLLSIDHRDEYPFKNKGSRWKYCSLTDPNTPQTRPWQTVSDIPDEAWGGWIMINDCLGTVSMFTPNNIVADDVGVVLRNTDNIRWKPRNSNPLKGEWRKCEVVC